jgi:hypothetical protein
MAKEIILSLVIGSILGSIFSFIYNGYFALGAVLGAPIGFILLIIYVFLTEVYESLNSFFSPPARYQPKSKIYSEDYSSINKTENQFTKNTTCIPINSVVENLLTSKVNGVSYTNEDGSSRQEIINILNIGEELALVKEPQNIHHKNAIQVVSKYGCIGYLPKKLADKLSGRINNYSKARLISKGSSSNNTLGCTIGIINEDTEITNRISDIKLEHTNNHNYNDDSPHLEEQYEMKYGNSPQGFYNPDTDETEYR